MCVRFAGALTAIVLLQSMGSPLRSAAAQDAPPLDLFFRAAGVDDRAATAAMTELARVWKNSYAAMVIDRARLMRRAPARIETNAPDSGFDDDTGEFRGSRGADNAALEGPGPFRRESIIRSRLLRFLEKQTRQRFGEDLNAWREWMWKLPYEPHPQYADFKGAVYAQIDRRFREFFPPGTRSLIRLDEVDWGGVVVNGIPPLYGPKVLAAADAKYLREGNIVFGVVVNGEARAYPKRILAWHEMAIDRIGGVDMTIVYCTLCGTVIPYESRVGGVARRFGTSGLLYRSNKLMFDEESKSLWSTLEGKPVIGPLAGSDLQLVSHPAVTTTWGEWRKEHPDTTVLSLETGHKRDYSEGAAYREYFGTDNLYFRVAHVDTRLKNKAEVLTLRVATPDGGEQAVAIAADFLKAHPVYQFDVGVRRFVVVTTERGANRVYDRTTPSVSFDTKPPVGSRVRDTGGQAWLVTEEALLLDSADARRLARVSAQRAFWFGWVAQFPDTVLIK